MHAEICPICKGKGEEYDSTLAAQQASPYKPCHGCNGKGWVEVGGDKQSVIPSISYPIGDDYRTKLL